MIEAIGAGGFRNYKQGYAGDMIQIGATAADNYEGIAWHDYGNPRAAGLPYGRLNRNIGWDGISCNMRSDLHDKDKMLHFLHTDDYAGSTFQLKTFDGSSETIDVGRVVTAVTVEFWVRFASKETDSHERSLVTVE